MIKLSDDERRKRKNDAQNNWRHKTGRCRPVSEARESALYLGYHIAERVLSGYFDGIKRMPLNNPGYDFICKNGYKIDVKSATLRNTSGMSGWKFRLGHNMTPDHYFCIGFDDRTNLNPVHVWLIPWDVVCDLTAIWIMDRPDKLALVAKYERPIDKVVQCCEKIRSAEVT